MSAAGSAQLQQTMRQVQRRPPPEALYTSPLRRAREVGAALSSCWGLAPRVASWAGEIDCGDVEGTPLRELKGQFPALWAANEAQDDDDFRWPGGESYREFRARVMAGLRELAADHPAARVALVTHAGVISQVLGVIAGRPASVWSRDRPDPLTATEIIWRGGVPEAVLNYNAPDWY